MHKARFFGLVVVLVGVAFCAVAAFGPDSVAGQGRGYTIDIKCNGQDSDVIVNSTDKVSIKIELVAGDLAGIPHDVWVVGMNSQGIHGSFEYATKTWYAGWTHVYYSGPVFDWSAYVLSQPIPVESYSCWFGLDSDPNGILETDKMVGCDRVDFEVVP